MRVLIFVCAGGLLPVTTANAGPPPGHFKRASSHFGCDANHGEGGAHGSQKVKVTLDEGRSLDKSFQQGSVRCCGGDDIDDANGRIKAWTLTAKDVYCGPSAGFGKGGVNMKAYVWVKQK